MATKKPVKKPAPKKKPTEKKPTREKAGRPPINDKSDSEAIQAKIDAYFDSLETNEEGIQESPTYSGLAYALGYASLQSLRENAKGTTAISLPIKVAFLRVDIAYEKRLHGNSPTGAIFALKNRGWTDKQENSEGEMDNRLTIDFTE